MAKKKTPAKSTKSRTTKKAARSSKPVRKSPKKKASRKKAPAKSTRVAETAESVTDESVTVDRRRTSDRRTDDSLLIPTGAESCAIDKPKLERRKKVTRRRQIDPTTCERDYTDTEIEFMNALDDYKRKSGRMFPTCSEVLEVIRELGYVQLSPSEQVASPPSDPLATTESLSDTTALATTGMLDDISGEQAGPELQGSGI